MIINPSLICPAGSCITSVEIVFGFRHQVLALESLSPNKFRQCSVCRQDAVLERSSTTANESTYMRPLP